MSLCQHGERSGAAKRRKRRNASQCLCELQVIAEIIQSAHVKILYVNRIKIFSRYLFHTTAKPCRNQAFKIQFLPTHTIFVAVWWMEL